MHNQIHHIVSLLQHKNFANC